MRFGLVVGGIACAFVLAGPVRAACTVGRIAELPVTMVGTQPVVDATINGRPVRFLADSGAFYSVITPGTAAELGLRLERLPNYTLRGVGGEAAAYVTRVQEFTVAGQPIRGVEFLVGGSEVGSAGMFGQNFLGLRDAEYDLGGGMIRLMVAKDCADGNLAYWANGKPVSQIRVEPTDRSNPHIKGEVLVNGIRMRAMFDTGATTSALTVAAAARAGVRTGDAGVERAGYSSGIGRGTVPSWIGHFASFAIGDEEVRNTRLRIADFKDGDFDMLVGADFFLSHRIYVANGLRRMFLTYNGGPVFNLRATPVAPRMTAAAGPEAARPEATRPEAAASKTASDGVAPTDADGLARRGAARAARRDYAGALADLDQALALDPRNLRMLVQRAHVHLALEQPLRAAGDLDQAIRVKPDDIEARMLRAALRVRAKDHDGAREDADAVAAAAAAPADVRLSLAALYDAIEAPAEAIRQLDLWIPAHPNDSRRPTALNARCWARALTGHDLAVALGDCNAALRARPDSASFLDSRGLVRLRMGDYDHSIADYDMALKAMPRLAWSLYGRGLAKRAKGAASDGDADIAAAAKLEPELPALARRYGVAPAG